MARTDRPPLVLYDIEDASSKFCEALGDLSVEEVEADWLVRAALERFVEIISEASRGVHKAWKAEHPDVPWAKIAGIGNVLRHEYRTASVEVIVRLRDTDLSVLEAAVADLLRKYDAEGLALRERLCTSGDLL